MVTSLYCVFTFFLKSRRAASRSALGIFLVLALCSRIRLLLSALISPSFTFRLSVYCFFATVMPDWRFFVFFFASKAAMSPAACCPPPPAAPDAPDALLLAAAPPPPVMVTVTGAACPTPPCPP